MKLFPRAVVLLSLALPVFLVNSCAKKVVEPELTVMVITEVQTPDDGIDKMHFADVQHGLMRSRNEIWKTSNGGLSWQFSVSCNTQGPLISIQYPNKDTAYYIVAASSNPYLRTVYRSTDGAQTWTAQSPMGRNFMACFYDGAHGYAYGEIPPSSTFQHLATSNAATSWTPTGRPLLSDPLDYMQFINANVGIGQNGMYVYNTFDGGVSWNNIGNQSYYYVPKLFPGGVVFKCDNNQNLQKSTDYGTTWHEVFANPDNLTIMDLDYSASGFCCINCSGHLYISRDSGETWKSVIDVTTDNQDLLVNFSFRYLHILDDHTIVAGGSSSHYNFIMVQVKIE